MKTFSKKITAVVMLAVMSLSAFCIGFATMFSAAPAIAEDTSAVSLPDTMIQLNIEDKITGITKYIAQGGVQFAHTAEASQQSTLNGSDIVFSDSIGQDKLNTIRTLTSGGTNYAIYTSKATEKDKDGEYVCNTNKYDGNISIYAAPIGGGRVFSRNRLAFRLNDSSIGHSAGTVTISFRMLYQEGYEYTFYENIANIANLNQYYSFKISDDGSVALGCVKGTAKTIDTATLLANLQKTNPTATALYETGDDLLITCGTFHTGTEAEANQKTNYYFKVENVTKGYTSFELLEQGDYYAYSSGYFAIDCYGINNKPFYFNLGGVERPIVAPEYSYEVEEALDETNIGKSVTSVELKEGYEHIAGNDAILVPGENVINVMYKAKYYDIDVVEEVTVTVKVDGQYVTIKDMYGESVGEYTTGATFELPTIESAKTFIAYKVGDVFYNQGDVVNLTGDTEITLYEADMCVEEQVSVRLSVSEKGLGGLRFAAKILTQDLNKLTESGFEVQTALVPFDMINKADAVKYSALVNAVTDVYTTAYFTVTDLNYGNFAREYAGRIAVVSGEFVAYSNTVKESAHSAALAAYDAYMTEFYNTGALNLSETNEKVLNGYVFGVLDVTYANQALTATEMGLPEQSLWFTDMNVTTAEETDGILTATVTYNVSANADVDLVTAGATAPVAVRLGDVIKAASVTGTTLEGDVLTVTFQVKVA